MPANWAATPALWAMRNGAGWSRVPSFNRRDLMAARAALVCSEGSASALGGRGCDLERAANALHSAGIDSEARGYLLRDLPRHCPFGAGRRVPARGRPEERLGKLEVMVAQATNDVGAVVPLFADLLAIPLSERYPALDLTRSSTRPSENSSPLALSSSNVSECAIQGIGRHLPA